MIMFFVKLLVWAIKAAWSISKVVLSLIVFPIVLIGLACAGFIYLALIILIICGIVSLIGSAVA
jgi:hypothetical protein